MYAWADDLVRRHKHSPSHMAGTNTSGIYYCLCRLCMQLLPWLYLLCGSLYTPFTLSQVTFNSGIVHESVTLKCCTHVGIPAAIILLP